MHLYVENGNLGNKVESRVQIVESGSEKVSLFGIADTIHLQNFGPTSENLKHGHIRCNGFWVTSCFRVHSSK